MQELAVNCPDCGGTFVFRSGKYGEFVGCSNFPNCRKTINITDFVYLFYKKYGFCVYCWNIVCWKCRKPTKVFSYFPLYDLSLYDEHFGYCMGIGLGSIPAMDSYMIDHYQNIKIMYSRTTNSSYAANSCEHCGALQGRNYVVDDPHEIMGSLFFNHDMYKYLHETITYDKVKLELSDIRQVFH